MPNLVSVNEAAKVLKVSPDTIRRRLDRGELTGERIPRAQGFSWRVDLNGTPQHIADPTSQDIAGVAALSIENQLLAQIELLTDQIQKKDEQITHMNNSLGLALHELSEVRRLALPTPKGLSWLSKLFHRR